jgi:hypothetical protein
MQARPVLFWLLVCVSLQFAATTSVEPASASITFEPLNCVACEAGFYLSQESLNCTACPAGSSTFDYRNASSALHCVCRPGFENQTEIGQDGEMCEPCRQGFFKENLANASCVRCPANSWTLDDGSANVSACVCDPGFSKPEPEDHALPCEPCEPGYYKPTQADEACLPCPEHHYCPSDSSQGSIEPRACPANSSAASPLPQVLVYETSATSRRAMRWRAIVEDCLCDAGFHFAVSSDSGAYYCEPCAPGFYNELANQSACVACPANTFNPGTAAASVADCSPCDANAAAPAASYEQTACACNLGYAGEPGQTCEACDPGTFRENSSSYICEACPANTYNGFFHSISREACLECHANTSSDPRSRSQRACVCNPGLSGVLLHGGTDGVYECTPCAAGTFAEAYNSSSCDACAAGKFSSSVAATDRDTCQACASGSIALELGMTACTLCGASTWQNTSSAEHLERACEACPANSSHALTGVTDVFECVCAPGVFKLPLDFGFRCALCEPGARCPGADRIEDCPFNTFAVGGVVTECTPCAEYSRAATSNPLTSPEQCQCVPGAEGTFHVNCSLCAQGRFQAIDLTFNGTYATGAATALAMTCELCAADHFQTQIGATACVACHAHSSTRGVAGSDAAEDCICDAGFVGPNGGACNSCSPGKFCLGGEFATDCRLFSHSQAGASQEAECACNAGYYSINVATPCLKCLPGVYCSGGVGYVPCANSSSSYPGSRTVQSVEVKSSKGSWYTENSCFTR